MQVDDFSVFSLSLSSFINVGFHEDTFATDSLRHILALLSSLDSHSFELQTSISLTNSRSRVKDLWIFTGPPSADDFLRDSPSPSILHSSPEIMRPTISPDPFAAPSSATQVHRRLVTEPLSSPRPASPLRHGRALTEDPQKHGEINPNASHAMPHNVLRKPAPRAQVPMSVHDDGENTETEEYRALLPSTIPSGVENMTGVGAATPDVFYSTPAFGTQAVEGQRSMTPSPNGHGQPMEQSPLAPEELEPSVDVPNTQSLSGPLLSPGAFRDSALSTTTDVSAVIPIKWTGLAVDGNDGNGRVPSTPMFPGGWQPTPVEEKDEHPATDAPLDIQLDQDKEPEEPVQDVRVASPEVMNGEIRQSEAGLIVTAAAPPPPSEAQEREMPENQEQRQTTASSGQGWVMVNVEQPPLSDDTPPVPETAAVQDTVPSVNTENKVSDASSSVPPAAKAIVIVDAIESKKPKSKDPQSSSRIRRFLSLTRRDSVS